MALSVASAHVRPRQLEVYARIQSCQEEILATGTADLQAKVDAGEITQEVMDRRVEKLNVLVEHPRKLNHRYHGLWKWVKNYSCQEQE